MLKFSKCVHPTNKIDSGLIPAGMFQFIQNFWFLKLHENEIVSSKTSFTEVGILILSGKCTIAGDNFNYPNLGSRQNVFDGLPTALYIPPGEEFKIIAQNKVELGICVSWCKESTRLGLIQPKDVKVLKVGKDNWRREVRIVIGENSPSVNLIVGECLNPAGNWSGTPPHRHECLNLPYESQHEELYFFKTVQPQGFGIQRLYSRAREINELILLKNNTLTFMPWGYHQIVAGPGYDLYYLFFLSGQGKQLVGLIDPKHEWLERKKKE